VEDYKCILSLHIARYLLAAGFTVIDIDTSKKIRGKLVFIFKNSSQLQEAMQNYLKGA
jgi:hypothetical protein